MEPSFSTGPIVQPPPAPSNGQGAETSRRPELSPAAKAMWIAAFVAYIVLALISGIELAVWTPIDVWIPIVAFSIATMSGSAGLALLLLSRMGARSADGRRRIRINPIELLGRMGIISAPLFLVIDIVFAVNCLMDPSAGPAQRVGVLEMNISKSKNSSNYNLIVRSWRPGEATIHLRADEDTYRQIERMPVEKRAAMVEVRKGRFGIAWTGSVAPAP